MGGMILDRLGKICLGRSYFFCGLKEIGVFLVEEIVYVGNDCIYLRN